jgi:hypothetical protein
MLFDSHAGFAKVQSSSPDVVIECKSLMPERRQHEFDNLLQDAQGGQNDSLGQLLERYRNYLNVVGRTQIDLHLAVRVSPSDVVQETFLRAARQFPTFRGDSQASCWRGSAGFWRAASSMPIRTCAQQKT